jgi:hypothetical protein
MLSPARALGHVDLPHECPAKRDRAPAPAHAARGGPCGRDAPVATKLVVKLAHAQLGHAGRDGAEDSSEELIREHVRGRERVVLELERVDGAPVAGYRRFDRRAQGVPTVGTHVQHVLGDLDGITGGHDGGGLQESSDEQAAMVVEAVSAAMLHRRSWKHFGSFGLALANLPVISFRS